MVKSVDGGGKAAPISSAPAPKTNLKASIGKNFTNSIINLAKAVAGGGGFRLTIAATGKCSNKA